MPNTNSFDIALDGFRTATIGQIKISTFGELDGVPITSDYIPDMAARARANLITQFREKL